MDKDTELEEYPMKMRIVIFRDPKHKHITRYPEVFLVLLVSGRCNEVQLAVWRPP